LDTVMAEEPEAFPPAIGEEPFCRKEQVRIVTR
jgi:hypothetical protein